MPGKRSNPAAIRKARLKQAYLDSDPETQRIIKGPTFTEAVMGFFNRAQERKRARFDPDIRGATVIGHKTQNKA